MCVEASRSVGSPRANTSLSFVGLFYKVDRVNLLHRSDYLYIHIILLLVYTLLLVYKHTNTNTIYTHFFYMYKQIYADIGIPFLSIYS